MSDGEKSVVTTLRLPRELWREIRVLAAREDKSASEWCREALQLVVDRMKGPHA